MNGQFFYFKANAFFVPTSISSLPFVTYERKLQSFPFERTVGKLTHPKDITDPVVLGQTGRNRVTNHDRTASRASMAGGRKTLNIGPIRFFCTISCAGSLNASAFGFLANPALPFLSLCSLPPGGARSSPGVRASGTECLERRAAQGVAAGF